MLEWGLGWVDVYNVLRPQGGVGMGGQSPLAVLKQLGHLGHDEMALFPLLLLDAIGTEVLLSRDPEGVTIF